MKQARPPAGTEFFPQRFYVFAKELEASKFLTPHSLNTAVDLVPEELAYPKLIAHKGITIGVRFASSHSNANVRYKLFWSKDCSLHHMK
jgi:hypothetical protein